MLTFYQFPGPWDVSSASPFCAKLEAFMLWQNISYDVVTVYSTKGSPKGKIPYIVDEKGKLGDSNFIIEYLTQKYNLNPDAGLTLEQKAQARAFRYICEESLYWAMSYFRWVDPQGWQVMKDTFFSRMPAMLRPVFIPMVQKYVRRMQYMQGMGRHTRQDIIRIACADLKALSDFLGSKPYFFGSKMTTTDLVVYSIVANFITGPFHNPVVDYAKNLDNLVEHTNRVRARCFPSGSLQRLKQAA